MLTNGKALEIDAETMGKLVTALTENSRKVPRELKDMLVDHAADLTDEGANRKFPSREFTPTDEGDEGWRLVLATETAQSLVSPLVTILDSRGQRNTRLLTAVTGTDEMVRGDIAGAEVTSVTICTSVSVSTDYIAVSKPTWKRPTTAATTDPAGFAGLMAQLSGAKATEEATEEAPEEAPEAPTPVKSSGATKATGARKATATKATATKATGTKGAGKSATSSIAGILAGI